MRVIERLTNQVGKVNTFTKQETVAGGLRRRDAHALRQNSDEVRESTPMPEQLLVAKVVRVKCS